MALAFPTIFLLDTHLPAEKLQEIKGQIKTLTDNIKEAKLVIARVATKQRAQFELRSRGIWTQDVDINEVVQRDAIPIPSIPPQKRRRVENVDSSTESDNEPHGRESSASSTDSTDPIIPAVTSSPAAGVTSQSSISTSIASQADIQTDDGTIKVVKLAWFEDSMKAGVLLPIDENYIVYRGRPIPKPNQTTSATTIKRPRPEDIILRAKADASVAKESSFPKHERNIGRNEKTRPTHLFRETTSEHGDSSSYPPLPSYFEMPYSCFWPTPPVTPNDTFISLLKKIQQVRELQGDEDYKVKTYGKAIAAIAAYPHTLSSSGELRRLPGCSDKFAFLFQEFLKTGTLQEAEKLEKDEQLSVMNQFYDIWGCADATALKFWNLGYRTIDDVVENHWTSLTREQQIGLKFYDDFLTTIPRAEVESIAKIVLETANSILEGGGFQKVIVGGYRRGKIESGDVDVLLSNPNEKATLGFIDPLVAELEDRGYVTHTLRIVQKNSERGQTPVSMKSEYSERGGRRHGHDSLDKAFVAWQDPDWPTKASDIAESIKSGTKVKNPNPHRRVDIIISPWATCGCAVAGWSSGRTFQRDLRSYCRKERGLKFDSTGVRKILDGSWVDLEGDVFVGEDGARVEGGVKGDMIEAEKRVFEGLGLEWLEPGLRCTG